MIAHDQNGNPLSPRPIQVTNRDGRRAWARQVWFGTNPATVVRWHVYGTRAAARDGGIADDYDNCPALIAMSIHNSGWRFPEE